MAVGGRAARREDILVTRMRWAGLGQGGDCREEEHEWGLRDTGAGTSRWGWMWLRRERNRGWLSWVEHGSGLGLGEVCRDTYGVPSEGIR